MNSIIIWVLLISPYSAYCLTNISIPFTTEVECEQVRAKIKDTKSFSVQCIPQKQLSEERK